jgi:syntaxin 5
MGDGTANRFDPKGKGRATPKNDELSLDLNAVEGGSANGHADGAFMQMQLVEQQVCFSHREKFIVTFLEIGYVHSTTLDCY